MEPNPKVNTGSKSVWGQGRSKGRFTSAVEQPRRDLQLQMAQPFESRFSTHVAAVSYRQDSTHVAAVSYRQDSTHVAAVSYRQEATQSCACWNPLEHLQAADRLRPTVGSPSSSSPAATQSGCPSSLQHADTVRLLVPSPLSHEIPNKSSEVEEPISVDSEWQAATPSAGRCPPSPPPPRECTALVQKLTAAL